MTADHPTREERRAMVLAVLEVHAGYEWWPMTREFICTCEASIGTSYPDAAHRAHVAAALVAADPAPAQPDAALSDELADAWERGAYAGREYQKELLTEWSRVGPPPTHTPNPYRAAQPVPAPDASRVYLDRLEKTQPGPEGQAVIDDIRGEMAAEVVELDSRRGGYDGLACSCGSTWFNVQAVALESDAVSVIAWAAPLTCRSCDAVLKDGVWLTPDLSVAPEVNPRGLPIERCGFANDPEHAPHEMTVTGEWPAGVPNRWCEGGRP